MTKKVKKNTKDKKGKIKLDGDALNYLTGKGSGDPDEGLETKVEEREERVESNNPREGINPIGDPLEYLMGKKEKKIINIQRPQGTFEGDDLNKKKEEK